MLTSGRDAKSRTTGGIVLVLLLAWVVSVSATTYMSVEPVPNRDVVGEANLAAIRNIGYVNLERWSQLLLGQCRVVDSVIDALKSNGALSSDITLTNTRVAVAAGGFEGSTNPSFVFNIQDSGPGSVAEADVNVISNALGYVLNQGGTSHFSPDHHNAYAFPLDFAIITFSGTLSGDEAQAFFEHVGTVDEALFSGLFAGFTQIDLPASTTNNSMLFLQPAVGKRQFISGLSAAAADDPRASYAPLKNNGAPTTLRAGVAFPFNDWLADPDGNQYLTNIGASDRLRGELLALRLLHLEAVTNLLDAIDEGRVMDYLFGGQFTCPN